MDRQVVGFTIPDPPSTAELNRCVHCGLCLPHCPTFQELRAEADSPRGRLHLMRALGEGRVDTSPTFILHIDRCLDCRACEAACPSGVRFGQLVEATRAEIRPRRPGSTWERAIRWLVLDQIVPRPGRLAALGGLLRAYQRLGVQRLVRGSGLLTRLSPRLAAAERLLPPLSARFFEPRGTIRPRGRPHRQVALFAGCVMRVAFAETNRATARVLARTGCAVAMPDDQACCGALHLHAGERELAKRLARRNIAAFESSGTDAIVVNAAGCGATLKEYGDLFAHDPAWSARARAFSDRVRDLSELLVELPPVTPRSLPPIRVVYQDACHLLHVQRIHEQPRTLLRSIPGIDLVEIADADRCCGSAGAYNVTQPDLAARFGAQKAECVLAADPDLLVSGNPGCLIQLRAELNQRGAKTRVVHLADLLDAAYR